LVRRICTQCREPFEPTEESLIELGMKREDLNGDTFFRGMGCDACNNTGYKGRTGLFELMIMDDRLREMIMANATADDLREAAREKGMISLRDAGISDMFKGITSVDEVIRETVLD